MIRLYRLNLALMLHILIIVEFTASESNGKSKGCYYKGEYHTGNWTDGCEFNCSCIDANTGYYKCHRRCPVQRHVPKGCILKLPDGEECCKQPDCNLLTADIKHINGDNDDNATDTNGNASKNSNGDDNGTEKGCFYKGQYHFGNWSDGCEFLCKCEDPVKGKYRCSKRCFSDPDVQTGCELKPAEDDPCCFVPVCNNPDTYTTFENYTAANFDEVFINPAEPQTLVVSLDSSLDSDQLLKEYSITDNLIVETNATFNETDLKNDRNNSSVGNFISDYLTVSYVQKSRLDHGFDNSRNIEAGLDDIKINSLVTDLTDKILPREMNQSLLKSLSMIDKQSSESNATLDTTLIEAIEINMNLSLNDTKVQQTTNYSRISENNISVTHSFLENMTDVDRSIVFENEPDADLNIPTTITPGNVTFMINENVTNETSIANEDHLSHLLNTNEHLNILTLKQNSSEELSSGNFTDIDLNSKPNDEVAIRNLNYSSESSSFNSSSFVSTSLDETINKQVNDNEFENSSFTYNTSQKNELKINLQSYGITSFLSEMEHEDTATIDNRLELYESELNESPYGNSKHEVASQMNSNHSLDNIVYKEDDISQTSENDTSTNQTLTIAINTSANQETTTPPSFNNLAEWTLSIDAKEKQHRKELFNDRNKENGESNSGVQLLNERCHYKGFYFDQGIKWYDGCDLICQCENAAIGFFKCRSRCPRYDIVPQGCILRISPGDSCCLDLVCRKTNTDIQPSVSQTLSPAESLEISQRNILRQTFNRRMAGRSDVFGLIPSSANSVMNLGESKAVSEKQGTGTRKERVFSRSYAENNSDKGQNLSLENDIQTTTENTMKSIIRNGLIIQQSSSKIETNLTTVEILNNKHNNISQEIVTLFPTKSAKELEKSANSSITESGKHDEFHNRTQFRTISTDTGVYNVRKIDGIINPNRKPVSGILRKMLYATKKKVSYEEENKEIKGWCEYKGWNFLEGTSWFDGCDFVCTCIGKGHSKYKCHQRCPEYKHTPPGCSLKAPQTNQCCSTLVCRNDVTSRG